MNDLAEEPTHPAALKASPRVLLTLAAIAVAFAAADTYVVVLALPDMMLTVGLDAEHLQRAAPIVSGFLLGYVAMLPLIGRLSDLRGRIPVLTAALLIFSLGSLVTALAHDLPTLVTGRLAQGLGGGGLVPATIALVADLYPSSRRALPLGIVSAVQEVGSVLGPLYGAAVLAVADWPAIFWINLSVGLLLAAAISQGSRLSSAEGAYRNPLHLQRRPKARRLDVVGLALLGLTVVALALALGRPDGLVQDVVLGWPFVPLMGSSLWLAPASLATIALALATLCWLWRAPSPLIDVRAWVRGARSADLLGSGLLAGALAGIIVAFASADPSSARFSPSAWWWLAGAAAFAALLLLHLRRASHPLVPRGAFTRRPAWISLVCNLLVGVALIAALVDVPVFARVTAYPDSQLGAALVLLRLLVAVPIGAVVGGFASHRLPYNLVAGAGIGLVAVGEFWMSRWDAGVLHSPLATPPLVIAGLGFGLCLAPLNAALLHATEPAVHGLASAFAVVARMVGMLVGISVLTEIGLHRFFAAQRALPSLSAVCGQVSSCPRYQALVDHTILTELTTVFAGAGICAVIAAAIALVGLGRHDA